MMAHPVEHVVHGFEVRYHGPHICIVGGPLHESAHLSLDALHLGDLWAQWAGLAEFAT